MLKSALQHWERFPTTRGIRWFNFLALSITHLIAAYGLWTVEIRKNTALFAVAYYAFSMLGELYRCFIHSSFDLH